MKLSGHHAITTAAVRDFAMEARLATLQCGDLGGGHAASDTLLRSGVTPWRLSSAVVRRDVVDVLTLGHWGTFGQKHHFMRHFNGQSPLAAYQEACAWIHDNALAFADGMAQGVGALRLRELGSACHAVQDSFSPGHVERDASAGDPAGEIRYVKLYIGHDRLGHDKGDMDWMVQGGGLSQRGMAAKEATQALLRMVTDHAESPFAPARTLTGWHDYRAKWLRASPEMARVDDVYDLIQSHRSRASVRTPWRIDARDLARALGDIGDVMKISRVFHRLRAAHRADADAVACEYVARARATPGGKAWNALRSDALHELLLELLENGWTTRQEAGAVAFLRSFTPLP